MCTACGPGTSTPGTGATACTPCGPGTYSPSTDVGCLLAPPGTFVNTTGEGGTSAVQRPACCCWCCCHPMCPVARAHCFASHPPLPSGAVTYKKCAFGSYASDAGNDKCDACPGGSYSNTQGAKVCKVCPSGTYAVSAATTCTAAPAGAYTAAGATTPVKCPKGTFNDQTRQGACFDCPPGYYCPVTGISSNPNAYGTKYTCGAGQYSTGGATACRSCAVNFFNATPAQSKCQACRLGTSTRGKTGSSTCTTARARKFM